MNLVIDSGNTAAKVGIFDHQTLIEKRTFAHQEELREWIGALDPAHMLVSSVRGDADDLLTLAPKASTRIALNRNLSLPIQNHYQTPDTLGMDRLAGACGAHALFPTQNCLVIDAGTCVTFDFV